MNVEDEEEIKLRFVLNEPQSWRERYNNYLKTHGKWWCADIMKCQSGPCKDRKEKAVKQVRIVLVDEKKEHIYLVQNRKGFRSLPGGKAADNEDEAVTVCREVLEETQYDVSKKVLYWVCEQDGISYYLITGLKYFKGSREGLLRNEIKNGGWYKRDEAMCTIKLPEVRQRLESLG